MFVYSFKRRFVEPIRLGLKRQTVRGIRKDGRRPSPGQDLRFYTAMRTRQCERIGDATCETCVAVELRLSLRKPAVILLPDNVAVSTLDPEMFARQDGFADWRELVDFWDREHHGITVFTGTLTTWGDLR